MTPKKVIMHVLVYKWWAKALMQPMTNGLITNCQDISEFMNLIKKSVKVLKEIFCDNNSDHIKSYSQIIQEYIESQK